MYYSMHTNQEEVIIVKSFNKMIRFTSDLIEEVQAYADKHYEGNFSQAVRVLIKKGLSA